MSSIKNTRRQKKRQSSPSKRIPDSFPVLSIATSSPSPQGRPSIFSSSSSSGLTPIKDLESSPPRESSSPAFLADKRHKHERKKSRKTSSTSETKIMAASSGDTHGILYKNVRAVDTAPSSASPTASFYAKSYSRKPSKLSTKTPVVRIIEKSPSQSPSAIEIDYSEFLIFPPSSDFNLSPIPFTTARDSVPTSHLPQTSLLCNKSSFYDPSSPTTAPSFQSQRTALYSPTHPPLPSPAKNSKSSSPSSTPRALEARWRQLSQEFCTLKGKCESWQQRNTALAVEFKRLAPLVGRMADLQNEAEAFEHEHQSHARKLKHLWEDRNRCHERTLREIGKDVGLDSADPMS